MEKLQGNTPKRLRQRKFLLVLPLLALPFITLLFWALGGGEMEKAEAQVGKQKGFNIQLPEPILKDNKAMDKMSYYDQARLDSVKYQELFINDPNYRNHAFSGMNDHHSAYEDWPAMLDKGGLNTSLYGNGNYNDTNEEKIYYKLSELKKEMNKTADPRDGSPLNKGSSNKAITVDSANIERLEHMVNMINQPNEDDAELSQLNGMLEKILDVQHPERVKEKLRQTSDTQRGQVFAVSTPEDNSVSLLDTGDALKNKANGFYSLNDVNMSHKTENAIQAVVHETQNILNGSIVKLRLLNDILVNDVHLPKDKFLFGVASLNGERLNIRINSILYKNSLFPVDLAVYDMDGLKGIYVPGAITRDVAKQSADRSLQTIGVTSLDPSLSAQAASAGIEAAKTLLGRKVKIIKVIVKAGYKVLLHDQKQKEAN